MWQKDWDTKAKTSWNLITNLLTATTMENQQPTNPTQYTLIADDYKEEEEQEDPKKLLHDLLAPTICQTARCCKCKNCITCIPSKMTTKERQDKEKKRKLHPQDIYRYIATYHTPWPQTEASTVS